MMYLNRNLRSTATLILLIGLLVVGNAKSDTFDHTYQSFGSLLSTYMSDGLVDYLTMHNDRSTLDNVISEFAALSKVEFDRFKRNEKIAYLINAYNLYTIHQIVDAYPVKSIKQISGVWNKNRFKIAGEMLTLDNVEHDMLRKAYHEPRVHVAVVCASISCPELWDHPFTPDSLDYQLNLRSAAFTNDIIRNRVDTATGTIYLSKIFKWYGGDFESYGKSSAYKGVSGNKAYVLNFLSQYWPEEVQNALHDKKLRTKFIGYDWNLNEVVKTNSASR